MQSGETHVELKALRRHGWIVIDLAREYSLSRDTVRRELASDGPRTYRERIKPSLQIQIDWAKLGLWPLGEHMVELSAVVALLGSSRAPAIRFASDQTRPTSFERVLRRLVDLGGVTREILSDRDSAIVIGATGDGRAILAPEWATSAPCWEWCLKPAVRIVPRPRLTHCTHLICKVRNERLASQPEGPSLAPS